VSIETKTYSGCVVAILLLLIVGSFWWWALLGMTYQVGMAVLVTAIVLLMVAAALHEAP